MPQKYPVIRYDSVKREPQFLPLPPDDPAGFSGTVGRCEQLRHQQLVVQEQADHFTTKAPSRNGTALLCKGNYGTSKEMIIR